jgi:hypothetical protein
MEEKIRILYLHEIPKNAWASEMAGRFCKQAVDMYFMSQRRTMTESYFTCKSTKRKAITQRSPLRECLSIEDVTDEEMRGNQEKLEEEELLLSELRDQMEEAEASLGVGYLYLVGKTSLQGGRGLPPDLAQQKCLIWRRQRE